MSCKFHVDELLKHTTYGQWLRKDIGREFFVTFRLECRKIVTKAHYVGSDSMVWDAMCRPKTSNVDF